MIMNATVLETDGSRLLVLDHGTGRNVVVHTPQAPGFVPGDRVRIEYSGIMTMSIPPQITARSIIRIPAPGPGPGPCGRCGRRR